MSEGPVQVLEALREALHHPSGQPCSGENLSEQLGVSRAQIWKHVESLRKRGYEISGEPGGGYRLERIPDRLYPEEIRAGSRLTWLAERIDYFDSTDSTNRVAHDLARAGAPHGTAVVAEAQTAGRGRLGRPFFSPSYLNLYTSVILRPDLTTAEAPTLIPTAAVAVADVIASHLPPLSAGEAVEIKWPNDVLLGGLKTSGILMEMSSEATRVGYVVIGIGVNLNVSPDDFPVDFRHLATSLRAHSGKPVNRAAFARRLYESLESVLDAHARGGFGALRNRFEARFRMPGRRVRIREMDAPDFIEWEAVVRGIQGDGSLQVERDNGDLQCVVAGDVTLVKGDHTSE